LETTRIAVIGPRLQAPAHEWMRTQVQAIEDRVCVVLDSAEFRPQCSVGCSSGLASSQLFDLPLILRRATSFLLRPKGKRSQTEITRIIREAGADVVLVHFLTTAVRFRSALVAAERPILVHCHGYDVTWDLRESSGPRFGEFAHPEDYQDSVLSLPASFRFIANSEHTKGKIEALGIASERIRVKHMSTPLPESLKRPSTEDGFLRVLYLGRLVDFKGPELTIKAFEIALDRGMQGELVVAGDGPLRACCEIIRARSRWSSRIRLLGEVPPEMGRRLREGADVFSAHSNKGVISNQEEAFGVAFVEAMAGGLPVLTGASGGLKEIITSGKDGLLFEPGDLEAQASSFVELARDSELRRRIGQRARESAESRFSVPVERRRLLKVVDDLRS